MNDTLADLLLGVIEGITEFLPISSTGHLLIAEHWLGARSDLFNIAIQAGAILAVVLIYRARLLELVLGLGQARNRAYAMKLAVAFGVTAVLGLIVKKLGVELPETLAPIAWALLVGGVVMLGAEALAARRGGDAAGAGGDRDNVSWTVAVLVGIAQVVAGVFPGTSRSAAAIFAALLFGRGSRVAATEFAFLVGIPTMFAATAYELLHVLKDGGAAGEDWTGLAIAFVASAITAFVAVKWLLGYIQTHRFTVFAWYRIALGAALLAWIMLGTNPTATRADVGAGANSAPSAPHAAVAISAADAVHAPGRAAPPDRNAPDEASAKRNARARAAEAALTTREYEGLKLCVDAELARTMVDSPDGRAMLESVAGGKFPAGMGAAARQDVTDRVAGMLQVLARAKSECADVGDRARDGSIYAVARRAAELGNQDAAGCYLLAPWPMSEARWRDGEERAAYMASAPRLIDAGIAAGDRRVLRTALMASYVSAAGPDADARARLPGRLNTAPWQDNATAWLQSIWPAGDAARYAALSYAELAGVAPSAARTQMEAQLRKVVAARLTPAQAARARASGQAIYRTAFARRAASEDDDAASCIGGS